MRRQKTPLTLPSYESMSGRQSSPESLVTETQWQDSSLFPEQFLTDDSYQTSDHHNSDFSCSAVENYPLQYLYIQNSEIQGTNDEVCSVYDTWSSAEPVYLQQFPNFNYSLLTGNGFQYVEGMRCYPQYLQFRTPIVTNYGAMSILLRDLIRVDLTPEGSVCVYNFPSRSVTALNAEGNKCCINHPNGCVYFEDSLIHVRTGNNRLARITPKGIMFSHSMLSIAYFIDESGTKTTCTKFEYLSGDLTSKIFHDGILLSYEELEEKCYKMLSQANYRVFSDGSELWVIGKIRIMQDRWGKVTVSQDNGRRSILVSPTIRSASFETSSVSILIDCFSKNYLTVRKESCQVTAGSCGLIVQSGSQKAGLDRTGKLVLF